MSTKVFFCFFIIEKGHILELDKNIRSREEEVVKWEEKLSIKQSKIDQNRLKLDQRESELNEIQKNLQNGEHKKFSSESINFFSIVEFAIFI